ncbi:MAG: adenylate/guanylate cyclase domain-containing protein [Rhodospirillales bacterium]
MWVRTLRTWSGVVFAAYVIAHLMNHSIGIFSLEAMERARPYFQAPFTNPVLFPLLYLSLFVHMALALTAVYRKRTLRMPVWQAVQLILGLLIWPLIALHIAGTRLVDLISDIEPNYPAVINSIFASGWLVVVKYVVLIFVVWFHLVVGVHFWLRIKPWYPRVMPWLFGSAVLLPVLATAGFLRAGMELKAMAAVNPGLIARILEPVQTSHLPIVRIVYDAESVMMTAGLSLVVMVFLARLARGLWRNKGGSYRITYYNSRQKFRAPVGQTVLETLQEFGVDHPAVCGGRGRCTTCRVRVNSDTEALHEPNDTEARALTRINADPSVRLACQLTPSSDIELTPVLPPNTSAADARRPGGVSGHERLVACLFIDLRGSTSLGEQKLPYDVVFILNQFFAEMSEALRLTNGHYAQFAGDGLMALYGLKSDIRDAARRAIEGGVEMHRRIEKLNEILDGELKEPLRIGVGLHAGEAIVGAMGPPAAPIISAIGDNINIAARLEAKTKEFGVPLILSKALAGYAEIDLDGYPLETMPVRGRNEELDAYLISDPESLQALLDKTAAPPARKQAATAT